MFTNLAIVDLETTGLKAPKDRIIEIGLVLVDQGKITKQWTSLLNPQTSVNPYIVSMTGIDPYQLHQAPTFAQLQDQIWADLQDRILVAHNARFDYGFLKNEFNRVDRNLSLEQLCTVRLSRKLYPQQSKHGLDSIIQRLDLKVVTRHRALDDALVVWKFLRTAQTQLGNQRLKRTIQTLIKKPALPSQIDQASVDQLPNCPGVYIFLDEAKAPLYIGKSIDIKARVKSHFYDDLHNHKELVLKQRVTGIQSITTAGELEALLLEAQLIKERQPVFNVKLRRHKHLHMLFPTTSAGYKTISSQTAIHCTLAQLQSQIALFRSKRDLKRALERVTKSHSLCPKLMGLEHTSTSCFSYRLKSCLGACVGKEPPASYNLRFERAFSKLCVPFWPYESAIQVHEHNPVTGQSAQLLFDKWCYIGKTTDSDQQMGDELTFDYDTYTILKNSLKTHPTSVKLM